MIKHRKAKLEINMLLENEVKNQTQVIKVLESRLDAHVSVSFKENILKVVEADDTKNILLDLSAVEFIDSSGLGAIVSCLKNIGMAGKKLSICSLQETTLSMFKLTRMDKVFVIYDDEDSALANAA